MHCPWISQMRTCILQSHTRNWKYLRFALSETERYQLRVLCFGVKTAPRVFSKVTVELGAILHSQAVEIYQYLDNWLIVHKDSSVLQKHLQLITNLTSLGFLINWDKSDIVSSKEFMYLGVRFNLQKKKSFIYYSVTLPHRRQA